MAFTPACEMSLLKAGLLCALLHHLSRPDWIHMKHCGAEPQQHQPTSPALLGSSPAILSSHMWSMQRLSMTLARSDEANLHHRCLATC